MSKSRAPNSRSRRNFLFALGIGSAGVSAAVFTTRVPATDLAGAAQQAPENRGYRATLHVKRYYQTARL